MVWLKLISYRLNFSLKIPFPLTDSSEGPKKSVTSIDLNVNDRVLCASTDVQKSGDCFLLFFDIRERKFLGSYWESHSEDITAAKFHPTNPDLLISGGIDGLINLFDISKPEEDDAMTNCFNMEGCIEKLFWLNKDKNNVISSISTTNELHFFDEQDLDLEIDTEAIARSMKRKSAVECNLIDIHSHKNGQAFVLAGSNFNNGECLRALKFENNELVPYANFAANSQIVRASAFCDSRNFMVTTGESGIVNLWRSEENEAHLAESTGLKMKQKLSGHRLKPY
jgi:WD40 repeat protein